MHRSNLAEREAELNKLAEKVVNSVNLRLRLYTQGLSGTRAAIAAVGFDSLNRQRFRNYVASRDLPNEFPGAKGFGFIRRVPATELESFLNAARADGLPSFQIRQFIPHAGDLFVIQYIEPESLNRQAIGLDIASEENRAQAALTAEKTDAVTLTAPITLVQKAGRKQEGFLFLLPIFRDALGPADETERSGAAVGWVYIPMLMSEIIAGLNENTDYYHVKISDVSNQNAPQVAYQTAEFQANTKAIISLSIDRPTYGRVWRYEFRATPQFIASLREYVPWKVGLSIFAFEALIIALLFAQLKNRQQAILSHKDKEQLAAIVDSSSDAIIGKKLDGTVISWNHAAEVMFGYTRHEAIGRTLVSLIIPEDMLDDEIKILGYLAAGRSIPHFETIRRRKDGTLLHASVAVSPIRNEYGEVIGASKTIRDITRQKEIENNVLMLNATLEAQVEERTHALNAALEAATQASRSKAEFLANMSHEIRSPMNAVLGLAYLAEQQTSDLHTRDLVRKISQSGRTLLGIINDILDFSKIEQGHLELENVTFRLQEVMDNLSTIMSSSVGNKPIEVIISPLPDELKLLSGDPLRLEQVLINLISNAIKFTERGHVLVSTRIISAQDTSLLLRFTVQDTGIGIPLEKQTSIFAPFTQADTSTTRQFGGTGLGLAISRQLVQMMGGEIGIFSAQGHGSEFWFTARFEKVDSETYVTPELADLNVLVADDNELALEAIKHTSEQLGWRTTAVRDGHDAIQSTMDLQVLGRLPDVLILDWQMPHKDGLEVARVVRQSLPEQETPIVVMVTAFSREMLVKSPDAHLADVLLPKPITASTLYDAVASAMRKRGWIKTNEAQTNSKHDRLHGLQLLIVDDSDINRDLASQIFRGEGAEVTTANDGLEALQCLEKQDFDAVLMDVQMPNMDGLEATSRIRRHERHQHLVIIALTAGAFTSQREAALAAGMNAVITKPFNVDRTVRMIMDLTGRSFVPNLEGGATQVIVQQRVGNTAHYAGIDLVQGLQIWSDEAVYQQYLRRFARDYADFISKISNLPLAEKSAMVHKFKGAAASLGLIRLSQLAGNVNENLMNNEPAKAELISLGNELQVVLASIAAYATDVLVPPLNKPPTLGRAQLLQLLATIEKMLNQDNPNGIQDLLSQLGHYTDQKELEALKADIEQFDFRHAEATLQHIKQSILTHFEA
ncbi:CHASE domain-containing protein [Chitinibacter sp. SCUT-21]|uniref:CHASE domain-containing protein n=1 Tax=Chitinibacter sp. SCUT-21 TaxID=2970891 RepID=UPI0035A6C6BF